MMTSGRKSILLYLAVILALGSCLGSALEAHHLFSHALPAASVICDNHPIDAEDAALPLPAAGWRPPLFAPHGVPAADRRSARMLPRAIFQPPERG